MKARVALVAGLFSLCLVAVAAAQVSTTTGTVVSNSGGSLVVDTASGQRTFMVDAQSSLPANLAAGSRVTVEYHTLANDQFHAFKVTTTGSSPTTGTAMAPPAATATAPAPAPAEPTMAAPTTPTASTTQERPTTTTPTDTTTTDTTTGTTMNDDTTTNRTLPATASPLPLLALGGSLALAGGLFLRRRRA